MKKKRRFTLLEVLICLAVVGLLSALFGIQGKDLLEQRRLQGSINLIHSEIEKAKFLSLAYRNDVELVLIQKQKEYYLQMKCDEPAFAKMKALSLPGIIKVRGQKKQASSFQLVNFSSGTLTAVFPCTLYGKNKLCRIDNKASFTTVDQNNF
ncbi:MAG: type II secretion system protein [Simkania sp.]|nr:type II secretion system protein [Simkania sp.]